MKVLLVIPSKMKHGVEALVSADQHPTMDYFALANELRNRGATVDFLDNSSVKGSRLPNDLSLAILTAKIARQYDAVFTNSESVSIPLSFFFRFFDKRPRHVTIAHKLTTGKKAVFFRQLKVQSDIDTLFVYAETQRRFGIDSLGIREDKLRLISFHADSDFFRPLPTIATVPGQFCSAGLEWRDYPSLVETARRLPDCTFKIAAASPWSKHKNELDGQQLPSNVSARRYEYGELRDLYAESVATIVPLYENDFQAGVTTILESMSVGRPVIATRTSGQKDVIIEGDTGFYVAPGDPSALTNAVSRLNGDAQLCAAMGARGREWLLQNASLERWSSTIAQDILCTDPSPA
jgi:glycosyltransferase involved in cell wall biosynthesis